MRVPSSNLDTDIDTEIDAQDTAAAEAADVPRKIRFKPDGTREPLAEVGWFLQRERVARAENLRQVGAAIGMDPLHLAAIEQGDLAFLPKGAQVFKLLEAYADYLGFEPGPLSAHYRAVLRGETLKAQDPDRLQQAVVWLGDYFEKAGRSVRHLPGPKLAGVVALLAVGLGAVYLFGGLSPTGGGDVMAGKPGPGEITGSVPNTAKPPVVARVKPAKPAGVRTAQKATSPVVRPVKPVKPGKPAPEVRISVKPISPSARPAPVPQADRDRLAALIARDIASAVKTAPREIRETRPQPVRTSPLKPGRAGAVHGKDNKNARLVFQAKERVWIRVEDRDGNILFARTLNAGDSYRVPDRPGIVLVARNAGALEYRVDGRLKGRLGSPGEIVIGLPLDLAKLAARRNKT
jgi:cytoskeleton protein RodZ